MVKALEHTALNMERALVSLIELWDKRINQPWEVEATRHASNVAMVSAYTQHVVNLSRAVLVLHRAGLDFELVGLVRSSMECVATTCWLYLFPEKTAQLVVSSSGELVKVVKSFEQAGFDISDDTVSAEHKVLLDKLGKPDDIEAQMLWRRFVAVGGGRQLYAIYRVLCSFDHATNALADQYTEAPDPDGPPHLRNTARDNDGDPSHYIGLQVLMLLRAQIAADLMLKKRRHHTQLDAWAARLGVDPRILAASDVEAAEADAAADGAQPTSTKPS